MKRVGSAAFTLLELLLVVAILGIIGAFVLPTANTILRGGKLNQASQTVVDRLSLARQSAIAQNRPVEVRFYRYKDPESPASSNSFRALQAFLVVKANQLNAMEKTQMLPSSVIIDSSPTLSSILDSSKRTLVTTGTTSIPRVGTNYSYIAVRFRPDGSTDLGPTTGPWFLTLHGESDKDGLTAPPPNFVTIAIDPVNGALSFFRPGI